MLRRGWVTWSNLWYQGNFGSSLEDWEMEAKNTELKIELLYDPATPFLGVYPDKTIIQKDTCIPMFIALFATAKAWKQPKCPSTGEWIKTMWYIWASQVVLVAKNLPANAGHIRDAGSFSWSGRSPGGGHGNPLQYSCLKNPHGQRNLAGYSPWGPKETRLRDCIYMCLYTHTHVCVHARLSKLHMYICMCACSVLCVWVYIYIYIYIYNGNYKKNEIMPFTATQMQLEIIILSEVSQKEKDKLPYKSLICGI